MSNWTNIGARPGIDHIAGDKMEIDDPQTENVDYVRTLLQHECQQVLVMQNDSFARTQQHQQHTTTAAAALTVTKKQRQHFWLLSNVLPLFHLQQ